MINSKYAILRDYIEPIYRFALKRLQHTQDAEDLAQEILLHVIKGMLVYEINNIDSWIWKVAHNRYNTFLRRKYNSEELAGEQIQYDSWTPDALVELIDSELSEQVFLALHSLSSMYREILIQFYVREKPIREIAAIYSLPESTVKWRLHSGKEKIRERIENGMTNRVYERINWWVACNGSFNSNRYLDSQIRRAICLAAYEKPLTIEEISSATGIPTLYIEDELSVLEYGDAIIKLGNKYATDFIILRKVDNDRLVTGFQPLIGTLADKFVSIFESKESDIRALNISGIASSMDKLGYLIIPLLLRGAVGHARGINGLAAPPFPPRKDGGNGWFIVEESDCVPPFNSGCNNYVFDKDWNEYISWFWVGKYFNQELKSTLNQLENSQVSLMIEKDHFSISGLDAETTARLLKLNLMKKCGGTYRPAFHYFRGNELTRFEALFEQEKQEIALIVEELVLTVYKGFKECVPERLHPQITGVFGSYLNSLVGYTIDELQRRGVLSPVGEDDILTANIMYVNKSAKNE